MTCKHEKMFSLHHYCPDCNMKWIDAIKEKESAEKEKTDIDYQKHIDLCKNLRVGDIIYGYHKDTNRGGKNNAPQFWLQYQIIGDTGRNFLLIPLKQSNTNSCVTGTHSHPIQADKKDLKEKGFFERRPPIKFVPTYELMEEQIFLSNKDFIVEKLEKCMDYNKLKAIYAMLCGSE